MLGKELPGLPHFCQKVFYIQANRALVFFIGFGKDQAKGDLPFFQVLNKLQVKFLRRMPAIDQYKDSDQVFAFAQVVFDHFLPFLSFCQRDFCKAVTRKVHDVPLAIDEKMVQEFGLTGCIGGFCQFFIAGKHVDEGGFTHITAAYKGVFRFIGFRAAGEVRAADNIGG